MNFFLLSLLFTLSFFNANAQVVFCPPGAEWHFEFSYSIFSPTRYNEKILYSRDSIIDGNSVKVLSHTKLTKLCNDHKVRVTVIKQKGDTIFFRNAYTSHKWEILYNFACQPGQSWTTTMYLPYFKSAHTATYTVESVSNVSVNGFMLKQLKIAGRELYITERFGSSLFLFDSGSYLTGNCDEDYVRSFLCYQDDSFGLNQFSDKPCDFKNYVSIDETFLNDRTFNVFPNPVNRVLTLELSAANISFSILNSLGQSVYEGTSAEEKQELDLSSLPPGIYYLTLQDRSAKKVLKLVKE